jgi:hypothetical protein
MKKYLPIYFYGLIILLEGFFLVFSEYYTFNIIKLSLGISLIIAALPAFMAVFSRQMKQVQIAYHEIHALTMLVYGISILLFCNTIEMIISFTAFLFIFYMFSEIVFCSWLFNLGRKVVYKIIIVRFLLGLATGVGTVAAMNSSSFKLEGFGILFIMVGINILFYVPVMKGNELSDVKLAEKEH